MRKKIAFVVLMLSLVLQLLPPIGATTAVAAAGNFIFPEESYDINAPRTTSDERVTLKGTINGVNPSSISYSIYQMVNGQVGEKRENLTNNITASGFNIEVFNLQLFPGLNKITFTGTQGGSQVTSSIYINYHNGPLFYNLEAHIDGERFPMKETGVTVVNSAPSRGRNTTDISILGNAPNATQVTIVVNGNSRTFPVNKTSNYSFVASPINLKKGKNLVTLKVSNNNQVIETTREIAFYNGEVIFYDVDIVDNAVATNTGALEYSSDFLSTSNSVKFKGKVIVPNKRYNDDADPELEPHPDPTLTLPIDYNIKQGTTDIVPVTTVASLVPSPTPAITNDFFEYEFEIPAAAVTFNNNYTIELKTINEEKSNRLPPVDIIKEGVTYNFKVMDKTAPYIHEINYLPGYKAGDAQAVYDVIQGVPVDGKNLYTQPFALEILIGNPGAATVNVTGIKDAAGSPATAGSYTETVLPGTATASRDINGVSTTFKRVLLQLTAPFEGTQTLDFKLSTSLAGVVDKTAKITMLVGTYATYDAVYDNMKIDIDTTVPNHMTNILNNDLDIFKGRIENVKNMGDIRYAPGGAGLPQTMFFYINNTAVKIDAPVATKKNEFQIIASDIPIAAGALIPGENIIKLMYQGSKASYVRTIKVYLVPTNLPVIPVEGSVGVFPYNADNVNPLPNDPDFPLVGSIYTTKKSEMKVFGTFDFIDLGQSVASDSPTSITNSAAAIQTKLNGLAADRDKYILRVESTNLAAPIEWDLRYELQVYDSSKPTVAAIAVNRAVDGYAGPVTGITVSYDLATQSFSFTLNKQTLNDNGSPSVYNFYVYNSGLVGPRASYRLEVDPIALPYDLVRPLLPKKAIVNKNFVEVIINAPSADTVVVNKVNAEKIKFDADNDNVIDYQHAFRAVVEGLKAGDNKITFTITNKNEKTSDSFVIKYSPTNIPGAQYLEEMKNSNKVFEGALSLTFPKGTTLIRRDFNLPEEYKNQVFTGHKLLFAIANPEDGVVDRHEFETLPINFDRILQNFGYRFKNSYPTRFTKASPVYWVDAGMADDLQTSGVYDPQTSGVDPYQFPNATGTYGTKLPTYDERPDSRELVLSKTGKMTLTFDPSMREGIGTIITTYRYDVKNKYWENVGGVVDAKKNTITVPFNQFGYYVVGKMINSFSDVTSHPYARNYMEAMYAKGIMNSAGTDEFGANIFISRGEFARMLVKALELPLNYELSKPHFDDVSPTINPDALWDYRYVETAARQGIIRGTQPRTFEPTNNLTRAEAAVILSRGLELKLDTDPTKIDKALQKQFKDYGDINFYARAAVSAIAKKGYIQGAPVDAADPKKGFVFEPQANLLRSDAAIIIGKMLADTKKLPKLN
ncbi:S-layer homology domain-containing protein [Paenibacillus oenotherae]|uniref:S-layer homology domain-containing protein n=1 Tax=Paenibacillus oenotherae TaxID=1435645 RepID=A0ABS7D770_9BACL|nr:S-layer homology domain-containing protein [Paenibacillus oenotherae]